MVGDNLPAGWSWSTIEELALPEGRPIVSGPFGSNIGKRFFVDAGVPVIRGNNLTMDMTRFIDDGFVFVTPQKADDLGNVDAKSGDLILTAAGSIGQVGIIPEDSRFSLYIISNKQIRVRLDRELIEPLFAFYWLSSPQMVDFIVQRNTGSSVPLINLSVVKQLPVPLAPPTVQKGILEILTALDDTICVHRRLNSALEKMARSIYKAWFIDFEPVKAKIEGATSFSGMPPEIFNKLPDRFGETELGLVPEGWTVGVLGDVVQERKYRVQPSPETRSLPYVPIDCITRKSIWLEHSKGGEEAKSSLVSFDEDDILFGAMRPYFHKVCLAPFAGTTRTTVFILRPKVLSDLSFSLLLLSESAI